MLNDQRKVISNIPISNFKLFDKLGLQQQKEKDYKIQEEELSQEFNKLRENKAYAEKLEFDKEFNKENLENKIPTTPLVTQQNPTYATRFCFCKEEAIRAISGPYSKHPGEVYWSCRRNRRYACRFFYFENEKLNFNYSQFNNKV